MEAPKPTRLVRIAAIIAPFALATGAIGSIVLMRLAGQLNDSPFVFAIISIWVLAPFVTLGFANIFSTGWSIPTRAALHAVILILTVGSLAIYGSILLTPGDSRTPTAFLGIPLLSLWLLAIIIPIAALRSGAPPRWKLIRWLMKGIAALAILAVIGIVSLVATLWWDHNRETILPVPTGPFAVSRTTFVWTDPAYPDSMAPHPNTPREIFAWIWYPADPGRSPKFVDYLPASWRSALQGRDNGIMTLLSRDLSRVRAHSLGDADVSPQQSSYPLIFMRAGLAAQTTDYTTLAEDLASHGYVVIGFDAPYRSGVVVFPDGRVIWRAPQNDVDAFAEPQADQLAAKLVQAWSADMTFALDQLQQLNTSDPTGKFVGRFDLQHIGVFGHSLGGATALQFCHDDPRCKAAIDVDGIPWGSVVHDGLTQPTLFLMSDHTSDAPDPDDHQIASNFQSIFDHAPKDRSLQITIRGSNHYMFSDDGWSPLLMRVLRIVGIV
jgi:dienelactone hydrolase